MFVKVIRNATNVLSQFLSPKRNDTNEVPVVKVRIIMNYCRCFVSMYVTMVGIRQIDSFSLRLAIKLTNRKMRVMRIA